MLALRRPDQHSEKCHLPPASKQLRQIRHKIPERDERDINREEYALTLARMTNQIVHQVAVCWHLLEHPWACPRVCVVVAHVYIGRAHGLPRSLPTHLGMESHRVHTHHLDKVFVRLPWQTVRIVQPCVSLFVSPSTTAANPKPLMRRRRTCAAAAKHLCRCKNSTRSV